MAAERHRTNYFADDGTGYNVLVPAYWSSVGHRQWDNSTDFHNGPIPPGLIMRRWNLITADGKRRRNFPCSRGFGDVAPPIGSTVVLPNIDGSLTTWTINGYSAQRYQPKKFKRKKR